MERYKKANEGIHASETLKRQTVQSGAPVRSKGTYALFRSYRFPRKAWFGAVAAVLVVAVLAGIIFWPGGGPLSQATYASAIALPEYPDMPKRPTGSNISSIAADKWRLAIQSQKAPLEKVTSKKQLSHFNTVTMQQFLGSSNGQNPVYSPLSLYLALAMTTELTDGNSRQQILDLLGVTNMEHLRKLASALWNANYRDDGTVTSRLASSIWLNEDVEFIQQTMDTLADTYYTSSFQGRMGSAALNSDLQRWINDQTGGLLADFSSNLELDPNTVLALVTTLYFSAKWDRLFTEENNTVETFHGAAADVETEFMNRKIEGSYYWGDCFSAVVNPFEAGGSMWLILPDEGVSMDELLADSQFSDFLAQGTLWENRTAMKVNLSLPKFDISSQLDLIDGLKSLGVTDVFDYQISDFSPTMQNADELFLDKVLQTGRVIVDEKGVEASSYTIVNVAPGAAPPPTEEIDFVLDRPFLFIIKSETGQFLFTGVVNQL